MNERTTALIFPPPTTQDHHNQDEQCAMQATSITTKPSDCNDGSNYRGKNCRSREVNVIGHSIVPLVLPSYPLHYLLGQLKARRSRVKFATAR